MRGRQLSALAKGASGPQCETKEERAEKDAVSFAPQSSAGQVGVEAPARDWKTAERTERRPNKWGKKWGGGGPQRLPRETVWDSRFGQLS